MSTNATATLERLDLNQVVREYAKKYQLPEDRIDAECQRVDEEIARVRKAADEASSRRRFSALEKNTPVEIAKLRDERVAVLEARKKEILSARQYADLDASYARIDMGFMSKRRPAGKHSCVRPQFALFDLSNPVCALNVDSSGGVNATPADLVKYWADIVDRLKVRSAFIVKRDNLRSASFDLRTEFGMSRIPDATREKILIATPRFDKLYVVTEAPEWEYQLTPKARPIAIADPLVIGAKGGYFWLVDTFDLTSAEKYIKDEFTYNV